MTKLFKQRSDTSILNLLQSVARQARTHTSRHLLDLGIYAGQDTIIALLAETDTMTPSEIAKALGVRPPTITKSIARLQEQGFVARSTGHTDGRQVRVQLTEAGNNILKQSRKAALKAEKQALKGLSEKQIKLLAESLCVIEESLLARDAKSQKKLIKKEQ